MRTLSDETVNVKQNKYAGLDIIEMLKNNKKIVAFLGASQAGTSFMVNNVAQLIASKGFDTAILDVTKNRSSYYIYTKNDVNIRNKASKSILNLKNGINDGINVKENLTVYTGVPGEDKNLEDADDILKTLVGNHTIILADCDLNTLPSYYAYAQDLYVVQTQDILTIPQVTEALLKIENSGVSVEGKLKILINKYIGVDGVTEKEIIGSLAFYNEPTMSYMKQLFEKNTVRYMTFPYDQDTCSKYLSCVAKCNVDFLNYPKEFKDLLEQLADNICS